MTPTKRYNISEKRVTPLAQLELHNGVLFSTPFQLEGRRIRPHHIREHFEKINELTLGDRFPIVAMTKNMTTQLPNPSIRMEYNRHLYKHISCIAFVSTSVKMNFFINLYFKLGPTKVPMKIFSSRDEAVKWAIMEDQKSKFSWCI